MKTLLLHLLGILSFFGTIGALVWGYFRRVDRKDRDIAVSMLNARMAMWDRRNPESWIWMKQREYYENINRWHGKGLPEDFFVPHPQSFAELAEQEPEAFTSVRFKHAPRADLHPCRARAIDTP